MLSVTWGVVAADQGGALIDVSAHMQRSGEGRGDGRGRGHGDVASLGVVRTLATSRLIVDTLVKLLVNVLPLLQLPSAKLLL